MNEVLALMAPYNDITRNRSLPPLDVILRCWICREELRKQGKLPEADAVRDKTLYRTLLVIIRAVSMCSRWCVCVCGGGV